MKQKRYISQYAAIGWGGLLKTALQPLERLQSRILKIIGIHEHEHNNPSRILQVVAINAIVYQYSELKMEYGYYWANTRKRGVEVPRNTLTKGKMSYISFAGKFFNVLPNN